MFGSIAKKTANQRTIEYQITEDGFPEWRTLADLCLVHNTGRQVVHQVKAVPYKSTNKRSNHPIANSLIIEKKGSQGANQKMQRDW